MIKNVIQNNIIITYDQILINTDFTIYIAKVPELKTLSINIKKKLIILKEINKQSSWLENSLLIFKTIFKQGDIKGIYLGGSRSLNINSKSSDYDIDIILDNKYEKFIISILKYSCPLIYLEENESEQHAHFYFNTVDNLTAYSSYLFEWIIENYLNRENNLNNALILDKSAINHYFNVTSKELYQESLISLKKLHKNLFDETINNNLTWLSKRLTKRVTHLVIINCLLRNKPIDKYKIIELKKYAKENENRLLIDPPIKYDISTMLYLKENIIELKKYFEKIDLVI